MAVRSRKEVEQGLTPKDAPADPVETATVVAVGQEAPEIDFVSLGPRKPKASDRWFVLMHPDSTASMPITATLNIDGEKVELERGRVETQSESVRDALLRSGYRYMNEEF